ncbi:MAG: hypothetical protein M1818_001628 [Claussenomyces sp. TS43310]|nr:MAG: hypothetical protein M1818_001628 [Claussenomyces sp. TS43310]
MAGDAEATEVVIRSEDAAEYAVDVEPERIVDDKYKSQPQDKVSLTHYGVGKLVGNFNGYFSGSSTTSQGSFSSSINKLTLYIVYLWIAKFVLSYVSMYTYRIVGLRISAAIRLAYLRTLFDQPISTLDKLPPGQAASTITNAANLLQLGISEKVARFFEATALLISAFVIAFVYSWKLTLVTSSMILFVVTIYSILVPIMVKLQKSKEHADAKALSIASEAFDAIRMIVACGAESRVAARFSGWVEESRRRGLKLSPVHGLSMAPVFFSVYADYALSFWFGIRLYSRGDIKSVSTVLIVLMSVLMSVMSISQVVAPIIAATKAAGAACTFFTMIDSPMVERDGLKEPDVSAGNNIIFKDITFAYPSRPYVKVLDGLDVCFEAGKLTAIVGPSGSGKSTVVGLIERWYSLSRGPAVGLPKAVNEKETKTVKYPGEEDTALITAGGEILVGDQNIEDLDVRWWRSQIGLVQQEPFIFNDTIHNNIAKGLIGSKFEHESEQFQRVLVEEACKESFADEFINRLPMGYETLVGDSGIKLSGGQRQRLAIARSIIKRPKILIFDEATSAIDVRSERIVQEALDRVAENRTTITIAHRLSTIKKADKIVVVAKGKVVEQGTHDELLMNTDGVYFGLVHAQHLAMDNPDALLDAEESNLTLTESSSPPLIDEKADFLTTVDVKPYKRRGFLRSFGVLLVEQKAHLPWLIFAVVGALGAGGAQPVQSYLMAQIIVVFQLTGQALVDGSEYWSLRFVYLAIGVGAGYFITGWAANSLSANVSSNYRQQYFESIIQKPIEFFDAEDNSSGTLVSRVSSDPTQLEEMMGTNMAVVLVAVFSIFGCIAIAFSFGWKLTLVALFSSLPIILSSSWYRTRFEVQFEQMNASVFAESSKFAAEAIGAFRTVTSLTLEDMICDRYATLLKAHVDKAWKKARYTTLVLALSDSVNMPCMALAFWYGGTLLANREYEPLQFFVIYTAIVQGTQQSGQWMGFGPNISQASGAANRILSFRVSASKTNKPTTRLPNSGGGVEIKFQNVHFIYPTRDTPIFAGLNLTIKAGQFAALVGASGCGKTSVISLLEQFYQIQKGTVSFDGTSIASLDIDEYRKAFSLVAQEPALFQGSIRENILLGVDENSVSDEQLYRTCRDAEIHDFIMSLPEGYQTDVGSRGVALSGGQKQRIAIARALIRNPRVLLLDEATSSLDSESEKLVQAAFERAGKGRTMIVVAHRLATVQNADVIFVLGNVEGGVGAKVLEQGSHAELIRRKGMYYQMCQNQALDR